MSVKSLIPKKKRAVDTIPIKVPHSIQQSIPISTIYKDGVFKVGNKYSKTWQFQDINYLVASDEDQLAMFMAHCNTINAFPADATFKISIFNRRLNPAKFEKETLLPMVEDGIDNLRVEINGQISNCAASSNNIVQEKYITVSVEKKTHEEARSYFNRIGNELAANFGKLSSKTTELSTDERLRLLHDFYRTGNEGNYRLNVKNAVRLGHDFKDYICPDGLQFKKDYFEMGWGASYYEAGGTGSATNSAEHRKFGRVVFLKEFPSFLHDSMVSEITDIHRDMMFSIDILPVPTDEAVKELQNRVLGIETDITRWQQKQNKNNNWATEPPYELSQMREEMKEFLDDLTQRDQRMSATRS